MLVGLALSMGVYAAEPADIVFKNAVIHTMDEAHPTAEAVAITGNTITYVGDNEGAKSLIGKGMVFDAGASCWVNGLKAHDFFTEQITKNVLNKLSKQD